MDRKPFVVVVGVDFEADSNHAFQTAMNLAAAHPSAIIHVVHVDGSWAADTGSPSDPRNFAERSDEALARIDELAARTIRGRIDARDPRVVQDVVGHFRSGKPAQEVVQLAVDVDADMIVVGTRGRRGLKRLLLGSVAAQVVKLARCPVFVVRPKDHGDVGEIPNVEAPCEDCVEARRTSEGGAFWCERHAAVHRVRAHRSRYRYQDPAPPSSSSTRWGAILD